MTAAVRLRDQQVRRTSRPTIDFKLLTLLATAVDGMRPMLSARCSGESFRTPPPDCSTRCDPLSYGEGWYWPYSARDSSSLHTHIRHCSVHDRYHTPRTVVSNYEGEKRCSML